MPYIATLKRPIHYEGLLNGHRIDEAIASPCESPSVLRVANTTRAIDQMPCRGEAATRLLVVMPTAHSLTQTGRPKRIVPTHCLRFKISHLYSRYNRFSITRERDHLLLLSASYKIAPEPAPCWWLLHQRHNLNVIGCCAQMVVPAVQDCKSADPRTDTPPVHC